MDIASLGGLLLGFAVIIVSILLSGASIMSFVDAPSLMIVLGGTIASTMTSAPIKQLASLPKLFLKALENRNSMPAAIINNIITLSGKARKEGLLSLEEAAQSVPDDFLKKGLMLVVDGTDPELVRTLLETEIDFIDQRHKTGQNLFETMATFAPGFGMLGTLIGLIKMLGQLSDPSSIGPSMAIALITTLYGSFLQNVVFQPIANKLKSKSAQEILEREIMIEGILSIQAGENPRIIEEKLKAFLPPSKRTGIGLSAQSQGE